MEIGIGFQWKGSSRLTVYQSLQLMLTMASLIVSLVGLMVAIVNLKNKK